MNDVSFVLVKFFCKEIVESIVQTKSHSRWIDSSTRTKEKLHFNEDQRTNFTSEWVQDILNFEALCES